ncbi:cyclic pyranopterin monophosphate synthase MoaC, partial [Candidatus Bathyarchaeota archaeon]
MKRVEMVGVGHKPDVRRVAVAEGKILLRPETLQRIRSGEVEKGDPLLVAQLAGILAAKRTPELIPLCHPIPITKVDVELEVQEDGVLARARVEAVAKTGVEMEALTAASVALLTVWDMVKQYEKDEAGQYPHTRITGI